MKRISILLLTIFLIGNIAKANHADTGTKRLACPQVIRTCSVHIEVENDFPVCKSCCTSKSKNSKCIGRCLKKCPKVSESPSSSSGGTSSSSSTGGIDNVTSND